MKSFKLVLIFSLILSIQAFAHTEFPGWPHTVIYDELLMRIPCSPIIANLDSLPDLEIVYRPEYDSIFVWKYDSFPLAGWPAFYSPGTFSWKSTCAVGDMDGDGHNDVVALMVEDTASIAKLYVYHENGTIHNGFPTPITPSACYGPTISDLDKDGKLETVIVPLHDNCIYVVDDDGNFLPGWPKKIHFEIEYERFNGNAAIGDLDLDGYPDIVAVSGYHLFAWSWNGIPLPGFPVNGPENWWMGYGYHSVLSDLEQDGKLEILVSACCGLNDWGGMLCAWNSDGEPLPGFPIINEVDPTCAPIPVDIDQDGYKEIIWCTYYAGDGYPNIHLFRHDGTYQPGWPIYFEWAHHFGDPIVADVNNDGWAEIIITDNGLENRKGRYYAYDRFGNLLSDYPKEIKGFARPPTLGDVNLDDTLDLVMSTDIPRVNPDTTFFFVHLLNMHTPYNPSLILWGKEYHDNYNTNNTEFGLIFIPGDTNHDGMVDIKDVLRLVYYLFKSGIPPYPLKSGDANSDSRVDIVDAVYIIKYILLGGPAPVQP